MGDAEADDRQPALGYGDAGCCCSVVWVGCLAAAGGVRVRSLLGTRSVQASSAFRAYGVRVRCTRALGWVRKVLLACVCLAAPGLLLLADGNKKREPCKALFSERKTGLKPATLSLEG